ncbi:TPA: twin-arginine translocase TatA/TatE family subunit [Candidatus Bathyarchaeota archaeon]|nr:twin-arginine translocase TatA/TatE family subunit [Candidatus Bathyarchaeota archaeon]
MVKPVELLEIFFVLAILLLIFGPKKLPEIARDIGEAVYEFRRASSGIKTSKRRKQTLEAEEAIRNLAQKLGIDTNGKTIKQLTNEILLRIKEDRT